MFMHKMLRASLAALGVLAVSAGSAQAQTDYPTKEVTLIVNYGAGGGTDLTARALASAAEKGLGQPIRVENRAGGSGTVGPTYIANAKKDGYTIGVASFVPMAIAPHMQEVPYTIESFKFLVGYGRYRYGIAVRADSPYQTIEELIEAAKSGEPLTFNSTSSLSQVLISRLSRATGAKFKPVSYKSGSEAATAALGGFIDVLMENPTSITPFVKSGEMRLLASASSVRWYELPDIPTLIEAGYDVSIESYAGLAAPVGVPDEVVQVLEAAFVKATSDPSVQETLKKLGMEPVHFTGEEYRKLVEDGYHAMDSDLREIGLKN